MHVRMQSQENVEISNPMYMREEADEDAETMVPTFVMAGDKVIRIAHQDFFFFFIELISLILCLTGDQFRQSGLRVDLQRFGVGQCGQRREEGSAPERDVTSAGASQRSPVG